MSRATLGIIIGNRDFFPDQLVTEARRDVLQLCKEMDIEPIMVGERETKLGGVETYQEAKLCGELFRKNQERIEGILVILPNFGDERGVADTIKFSQLDVPILVQAYPDDLSAFNLERRRDGFCGKISVCNDLRQYGYAYSLTNLHTVYPLSPSFRKDLERFIGVCKVSNGLKKARLGAIGARPGAFNTVRFSEKLLQNYGITVVTVDLSEILYVANRFKDDDKVIRTKLEEIQGYIKTNGVPPAALMRMAKLGLAIQMWMDENDLQASAIQCWSSVQKNAGVNVCTLMSMMSEKLLPSACEVDVTGVTSMYALQLASGKPSALVDWNNNYGDDPNKCVLFHCGNWAKSFFSDAEMRNADVLGTTLGQENTFGAISGRVPSGVLTYARITTDDVEGVIRTYVGEGRFTDDPLDTFGARAVVEVPKLQQLIKYICKNGFEHHSAMNASQVADVLKEAFETYMGWEVYHHCDADNF